MMVSRMMRTERRASMMMMAVRRISSLARLGGSIISMLASPMGLLASTEVPIPPTSGTDK